MLLCVRTSYVEGPHWVCACTMYCLLTTSTLLSFRSLATNYNPNNNVAHRRTSQLVWRVLTTSQIATKQSIHTNRSAEYQKWPLYLLVHEGILQQSPNHRGLLTVERDFSTRYSVKNPKQPFFALKSHITPLQLMYSLPRTSSQVLLYSLDVL